MSDFKFMQYCDNCDDNTPHKSEIGKCCHNGGYGYRDDYIIHETCLECGNTIETI